MTRDDTDAGGGERRFPPTHWSMVRDLGQRDHPDWQARFDALARTYWKPVYLHIRIRWRATNDEAKDLTQGFFLEMLEGRLLEAGEELRHRFRTYLKACLENYLRRAHRDRNRLKRGGGQQVLGLDESGPIELPSPDLTPDQVLDREWCKTTMKQALRRLESHYVDGDRAAYFEVFSRLKLDPGDDRPSRADVAQALGLTVSDVGNYLAHAKRTLQQMIREVVSETVSSKAALAEELAELRMLSGG